MSAVLNGICQNLSCTSGAHHEDTKLFFISLLIDSLQSMSQYARGKPCTSSSGDAFVYGSSLTKKDEQLTIKGNTATMENIPLGPMFSSKYPLQKEQATPPTAAEAQHSDWRPPVVDCKKMNMKLRTRCIF